MKDDKKSSFVKKKLSHSFRYFDSDLISSKHIFVYQIVLQIAALSEPIAHIPCLIQHLPLLGIAYRPA